MSRPGHTTDARHPRVSTCRDCPSHRLVLGPTHGRDGRACCACGYSDLGLLGRHAELKGLHDPAIGRADDCLFVLVARAGTSAGRQQQLLKQTLELSR